MLWRVKKLLFNFFFFFFWRGRGGGWRVKPIASCILRKTVSVNEAVQRLWGGKAYLLRVETFVLLSSPVLQHGEVLEVVLAVDGNVSWAAVPQDHWWVWCLPPTWEWQWNTVCFFTSDTSVMFASLLQSLPFLTFQIIPEMTGNGGSYLVSHVARKQNTLFRRGRHEAW